MVALSLALQGTQGAGRICHASALRGTAADTSATVGSVVTLSAVTVRLLALLYWIDPGVIIVFAGFSGWAGGVCDQRESFSDSRSMKGGLVAIFLSESSGGVYLLGRTNKGGGPFRFDVSVRWALVFELGAT